MKKQAILILLFALILACEKSESENENLEFCELKPNDAEVVFESNFGSVYLFEWMSENGLEEIQTTCNYKNNSHYVDSDDCYIILERHYDWDLNILYNLNDNSVIRIEKLTTASDSVFEITNYPPNADTYTTYIANLDRMLSRVAKLEFSYMASENNINWQAYQSYIYLKNALRQIVLASDFVDSNYIPESLMMFPGKLHLSSISHFNIIPSSGGNILTITKEGNKEYELKIRTRNRKYYTLGLETGILDLGYSDSSGDAILFMPTNESEKLAYKEAISEMIDGILQMEEMSNETCSFYPYGEFPALAEAKEYLNNVLSNL